jgi:shikimate dehydrogenase
MILSGKARIAGVMGWPVSHSRSPRLHGYWLDAYRIDGAYIPLAVPPDSARDAIRALPALGFRGVNVTVPHKETALAAVDEVDSHARRIGAVNTIIVGDDGRLIGSNTDGFGFMENLAAATPDWPRDRPAVVLGAGGASRAIIIALIDAGVPDIRITNRTESRATALAEEFSGPCSVVPWEDRSGCLESAGLLVNTTTLGMGGAATLDLSLDDLPDDAVVTDIVYTPLRTPLLEDAAARGHRTVDGLGMLLHQARPGFAAWFGQEPKVSQALRAFILEDLTR